MGSESAANLYIEYIYIYENAVNNYFDPNCISPIYINHVIILFIIRNFNIFI